MDKLAFAAENLPRIGSTPARPGIAGDWRRGLPVLLDRRVRLRELCPNDARPLLALLATPETTRFISPPPTTVEGFERFIAWMINQRMHGAHVGFAITLRGSDAPIGIFQVRQLERSFETAEWGFVLGSPFWGTGIFEEGARLLLDFVFHTLGVHRLEARAAARNGRGNGALRKLGAVQEGLLRRSLYRDGEYLDQILYAILADEWEARSAAARGPERLRIH